METGILKSDSPDSHTTTSDPGFNMEVRYLRKVSGFDDGRAWWRWKLLFRNRGIHEPSANRMRKREIGEI